MGLDKFIDVKKNTSFNKDKRLNFELKSLEVERQDDKFLPWFLKYKPSQSNQIIETRTIGEVRDFLMNFKRGKSLLLFGLAGSGKTTCVNYLADVLNYEILEVNASDSRNKKSIAQIVGSAIKQKPLFKKKKLILLDEVDGVAGREDRGGVAEVVKIVKSSAYPIILTANNIEEDKIKAVRKVSVLVDFNDNTVEILEKLGKRILEAENIDFDKRVFLDFVNSHNFNDIRGFINDLQLACFEGKFKPLGEVESRDYKKLVERLLRIIYFEDSRKALNVTYNSDVNLDDLMNFLEENSYKFASGIDICNLYNQISKADLYYGRIMRRQHWRFLVYINFYLTYAVSCFSEKQASCSKRVKFEQNSRFLKKWIYQNKYSVFKSRTKIQRNKGEDERLVEKIADKIKCSVKKTKSDYLPFFLFKFQNCVDFRNYVRDEFEIDSKDFEKLKSLKL